MSKRPVALMSEEELRKLCSIDFEKKVEDNIRKAKRAFVQEIQDKIIEYVDNYEKSKKKSPGLDNLNQNDMFKSALSNIYDNDGHITLDESQIHEEYSVENDGANKADKTRPAVLEPRKSVQPAETGSQLKVSQQIKLNNTPTEIANGSYQYTGESYEYESYYDNNQEKKDDAVTNKKPHFVNNGGESFNDDLVDGIV